MISRLVMQVDGWVAPIVQAKADLIDLEGTTKQVFASLRQGMRFGDAGKSNAASLMDAKNAIVDVGNQWNSFLSNTAGAESYAAATKNLFSTIRGSVASLGVATESINRVTTASTQAGTAHQQNAESTGLLGKISRLTGVDVAELAGVVGKKAVIGYLAYRLGIDEVIEASRRHLGANSNLRQSVGGLMSSFENLTGTLTGAFITGVKASLMAVVEMTTGYTSFGDMVDDAAATVTRWANSATTAIKDVNDKARELTLVASTAFAVFHGADATAFYEEGQALNQLADATANVIQKQEQQRAALSYIKAASESAAAAQQTAAEVSRIGTIASVEALDQELQNLRLKALEQEKSVTNSKAWQQQVSQVTAAIEKQRAAIQGGTVKPQASAVDQQIKAAEDALNRMAVGDQQAALSTAALNGATSEQINRLRAALVATDDLTRAKKEQEEADRKAADAQREAAARFSQGTDTIQKLKGEIDLLTGAATKAEVAARNLISQGFDEAQANEIGRLTEQLDALRAGEKSSKSSDRQGANTAALKGTAEANAILLRGVGGPQEKKTEELQKETVNQLKNVVTAIKQSKPTVELQTADL